MSSNQVEFFFQKGLAAHQKGDLKLAESYYQKIIQMDSNHSDAYHLIGVINSEQGKNEKAIENIKKAIQLSKNEIYLNSLGVIYLRQGNIQDAIMFFKKALAYDDKYSDAYNNLGQAQLIVGDIYESTKNFHKGLISAYNAPQLFSNYLMSLNYNPIMSPEKIYNEHFKYNELFHSCRKYDHQFDKNKKKLKIGYVSSDFCQNSVAYFVESILKYHDRNHFEIYCYSDVIQSDEITHRLKQYASKWVNCLAMTDDQMTECIYNDEIDILVDLSGHFSGNRLPVFAQQPAKIQVTYLGYPNTTGLSSIQYRFTDAISDPDTLDSFYSEHLVKLENGFLCYHPQHDSSDVSSLPAEKNGFITLGSFNNLAKVNQTVIQTWAKILCQMPDAKLLLKARPLSDKKTQDYIINKFVSNGAKKDQIQCMGFLDSIQSHFEAYHYVDLALDPFPYNGTTTTCDALWMGVPVVTKCDITHAGRVGSSILTHVGLNDFISNSTEAYIAKTVSICNNISLLKNMRKHIRTIFQNSPLMDGKRFTEKLEQTYQQIWQQL
jgi:predicted O-linked N-acetylglucosamine transferase (SPINDLY family)